MCNGFYTWINCSNFRVKASMRKIPISISVCSVISVAEFLTLFL
jgi:hypothetical protein